MEFFVFSLKNAPSLNLVFYTIFRFRDIVVAKKTLRRYQKFYEYEFIFVEYTIDNRIALGLSLSVSVLTFLTIGYKLYINMATILISYYIGDFYERIQRLTNCR